MKSDHYAQIIDFLSRARSYPHKVTNLQRIETHISDVFLTGELAYKLKKPVHFDFLDFSTLGKRKHFCEEEVGFNSRFSPELYLGVVPIVRKGEKLELGGEGEVVEYLVKMRQFDQDGLFDRLAVRGELTETLLLELAQEIARFHLAAVRVEGYGVPESVQQEMNRNLTVCTELLREKEGRHLIEPLSTAWSKAYQALVPLMERRQHTHVRALHGDMHLRNVCIYKKKVCLFDGIEFNPQLSNCDVWADLAFLLMDLWHRELPQGAALIWNSYLQETDDFEGIKLLSLYMAYRAAVRAKVAGLGPHGRAHQRDDERTEDIVSYLSLAVDAMQPGRPQIIAVGGLSGAGKSTISSYLGRALQAVHIRSDAVRKHLARVPLLEPAPPEAYTEEMNVRTYRGLFERAKFVLDSGRVAIIDAVFHSPVWRKEVEELAAREDLPFTGFWCEVPLKIAKERVRNRVNDISDADETVVAKQAHDLDAIHWQKLDTSKDVEDSVYAALQWLRA